MNRRSAFTLIELLVVMAVIAILAAMLLPVLSKAKLKAQSARCTGNLQRLSLCWILYYGDSADRLVPNWLFTSNAWITGWLRDLPDATNEANIRNGRLFAYDETLEIYSCPGANELPASLQSPSTRGQRLVRNYALSGRMGGADAQDARRYGVPDTTFVLGPNYRLYQKASEIVQPPPAQALLFVDESIETIDDGYFAVRTMPLWQHSPTARHNRGATFSFADGHAEYWHWGELGWEQGPNTPVNARGADTSADLKRLQAVVAGPR